MVTPTSTISVHRIVPLCIMRTDGLDSNVYIVGPGTISIFPEVEVGITSGVLYIALKISPTITVIHYYYAILNIIKCSVLAY